MSVIRVRPERCFASNGERAADDKEGQAGGQRRSQSSGDLGSRGFSLRNAEDADGLASVVDLADVELAALGETLTDHLLDRRDRLVPRPVARDVIGVDALLNDENAHVHSLGAPPLMHDFCDRFEQLLRMCPEVDVSASPLLSQGNPEQALCGQLEPSYEAARPLARSDSLVVFEPMADASSEKFRD